MMKKSFWLALGILFPLLLWGQGQTSNWYFGNGAGIRFTNDGDVEALEESKLQTFEGCASISDTSGNLLFYTDGITVYNSRHQVMNNGSGLYGDPSSTQSAIIVPKPEDPFIYYILTVDTSAFFNDPDRGLNYSVVDIRMDDGQGAVVAKNVTLLKKCTEKVAAIIRNCFDRSIWVLTQGPEEPEGEVYNTFYAFEITTKGINTKPVKTVFPLWSVGDPRGYLKLNSTGTTLVSANYTSGLHLFDFDLDTGIPSNRLELEIAGPNSNPYGVEFSPNNRWLYVNSSSIPIPPSEEFNSSLLQIDLEAPDPSATVTVLDERPLYRGALQLGENGKIYRTLAANYNVGSPFLGVLHNPDAQGMAASYEHNAIDLKGRDATQGLPPFIQSFFGKTKLVKNADGTTTNDLALCEGDGFILEIEAFPGAIYTWLKDGLPLEVPSGNRIEVAQAQPGDQGRYSVEVVLADPTKCPILGESFISVLPKPETEISVLKCDYDLENSNDGITEIDLSEIAEDPDITFTFYLDELALADNTAITGIENFVNTTPFSQTLWYRAVNTLGCIAEGTVLLEISPGEVSPSSFGPVQRCDEGLDETVLTASFDLEEVAAYYPGLDIVFFPSIEDLAEGSNALGASLVTASTTIFARKAAGDQCLGVEVINLLVQPAPQLEFPEKFSLCQNNPVLLLSAPAGFDEYAWKRTVGAVTKVISTEKDLLVRELGDYSLEARINYGALAAASGCTKSVDFVVEASEVARIDNILVEDFSKNNTVTITVSGDGDYEYSLDGLNFQEQNRFEAVDPGFVTAYVRDKNGCGIQEKEVSVLGYPKFFTPNGDGVNDYWQLQGVDELFQPRALITIYDRFGQYVTQIPPDGPGWDGISQGKAYPASDYWFRIFLVDGREVKGHFALKR